MSYLCKHCWASKENCNLCVHQPGLSDLYLHHPITCKFGYKNCINDPGYIFAVDLEWYKELYGDKNIYEAAKDEEGCGNCSKKYCHYDTEDK